MNKAVDFTPGCDAIPKLSSFNLEVGMLVHPQKVGTKCGLWARSVYGNIPRAIQRFNIILLISCHQNMLMSWYGNVICITDPLWGESIGVISVNKLLNNQSICWWFGKTRRPCDAIVMSYTHSSQVTGINLKLQSQPQQDKAKQIYENIPPLSALLQLHLRDQQFYCLIRRGFY